MFFVINGCKLICTSQQLRNKTTSTQFLLSGNNIEKGNSTYNINKEPLKMYRAERLFSNTPNSVVGANCIYM